jgi:hypothetical protein
MQGLEFDELMIPHLFTSRGEIMATGLLDKKKKSIMKNCP